MLQHSPAKSGSGFTLVEVVVSLAILAIVIAAFLAVITRSVAAVGTARRDILNAFILNDLVERARIACSPPGRVQAVVNGVPSNVVIEPGFRAGYGAKITVNIRDPGQSRTVSGTTWLGNCLR